jgi:23S rRNA (guanosine2251-2'-O)-methyltransferase
LELSSVARNLDLDTFLASKTDSTSVLVLDGVTDPHNLGACFRVACAAGISAIVVPRDKAASVNSTVAKAASGALEHVFYIQVPNLARALQSLKENGFFVMGADERGTDAIYDVPMLDNIAFVLGREGDGLRELTKKTCDQLVRVPMLGEIESLNVSVCAGVLLYERVRQISMGARAKKVNTKVN